MILKRLLSKALSKKYGWFGDYKSWKEAMKVSGGYDSSEILEKVKSAVLKVKNGEAEFERDSVLFYEKEYSWALLSGLLLVAGKNAGKLRLIDFGGSLGSTYFQHKPFLDNLPQVSWNIVEQENFYKTGKVIFQNNVLKFYPDIASCLKDDQVDAILLGCVLPYMETPYIFLEEIFKYKISYLLIDRMPFINSEYDRLTVQKVPPYIYKASYPAWFFSYKKFIANIQQHYTILAEYKCNDIANIKSTYKGLILKLIHESC